MHVTFRVLVAAACMAAAPTSIAMAQDAADVLEQKTVALSGKYMNNLRTLATSAKAIAEAQGLKEEVEKQDKAIADLEANMNKPSAKTIASVQQIVTDNGKQFAKTAAEPISAMSVESKAMLVKGLIAYVIGMKETIDLTAESASLTTAVGDAMKVNPLRLRKVASSMAAAKEMSTGIPALAKQHTETMANIKKYATMNKLPIDMAALSQ